MILANPSSSPHVLHIMPSFGIGGISLRLACIINHLGSRCRHSIFSLDGVVSSSTRLNRDLAVEVVPLSLDKSKWVSNIFNHRRAIIGCNPDILATYNWGSIDWVIANHLWVGIRHYHMEDGFGVEEASRQLHRRVLARRILLRRSAKIVVPSQTLERIAREVWRLPAERILLVPNGIDPGLYAEWARDARRTENDPIVIGTIAPLRPEKNLSRLIRGFSALETHRYRLVIAGDGNERSKLEALVVELGLTDRVAFLGRTDSPHKVLEQFDIFALSSDTEQMPIALLEAMAVGLPIAAVDVGDVGVMVAPENREFVVPRDKPGALARAMDALGADEDLRVRIGKRNREWATTHFDQKRMFAAYEGLFLGRELAHEAAPRGPSV